VVKIFLGRDPNLSQNNDHHHALCAAGAGGHIDAVRLFHKIISETSETMENEALFDKPDVLGNTVLHIAASAGHAHIVKFLIERDCDVWQKNKAGEDVWHFALTKKRTRVVDALLKADKQSKTSLHKAAAHGHKNVTDKVLETNNKVSGLKNEYGMTFVHVAPRHNQDQILENYLTRYPDMVIQQDSNHNTPLHIAAQEGHERSVFVLREDNTPLHTAAAGRNEAVIRHPCYT